MDVTDDDFFARVDRLGQRSYLQEATNSFAPWPRRSDEEYDPVQDHSSTWTREDETTLDPMHLSAIGKLCYL